MIRYNNGEQWETKETMANKGYTRQYLEAQWDKWKQAETSGSACGCQRTSRRLNKGWKQQKVGRCNILLLSQAFPPLPPFPMAFLMSSRPSTCLPLASDTSTDFHMLLLRASEQWPEIPAVRFGPKGMSLSHCASAHYSLFIIAFFGPILELL